MKPDKESLTVYIPDTRGVTVSPYGKGNMKIGMEVFTYSRLPGRPDQKALGSEELFFPLASDPHGTCPGATEECLAICYARRPVAEDGLVYRMWRDNSVNDAVQPIPAACKLLRIHIAGDFTSAEYIENWIKRLQERPDVTGWAYTRSWRVKSLLEPLMRLQSLPNFTLWASMDPSTVETPPRGWRIAWIEGDSRLTPVNEHLATRVEPLKVDGVFDTNPASWPKVTIGKVSSYTCPEETGRRRDCVSCQYCFKGDKGDVTFLRH